MVRTRKQFEEKESSYEEESAEDESPDSEKEDQESADPEDLTASTKPTSDQADPSNNPTAENDPLVPKVGMSFNSVDEAFLFYTAYGYRTGFGVTRRTSHNVHGRKYRQTFTCFKEGNPRIKKAVNKCRRRPIVKCGCRAMMVIKDLSFKDCWVIDYVILKHNHPLDPDRVRFMKCFRDLPVSIKQQLNFKEETIKDVVSHESEIRTCSTSMSNQRDWKNPNNIDCIGMLRLREGDARALMQFFDRKQVENPGFFHSCDTDENGLLMNVFWADARSRSMYRYFNDVITLDTTYMSSKYNVPLVSFLGVNNHGNHTLLGCAILSNGTKESFTWVLKRWLSCMNDNHPVSIITDYEESIRASVSEVFPESRHRFFHSRILGKILEKLGKNYIKEAINDKITKAVCGSLTPDGFETEWREIEDLYELRNYTWFASLYEDRKQWTPAYIKDSFWAETESEGANPFFEGCITTKTTMKKFLEQYDGFMTDRWDREAQEDYKSYHGSPQLISGFEFEKQIARAYTNNMFQKFQDEVRQLIQCVCTVIERNGPAVTYTVTELVDQQQLEYRVVYDSSVDWMIWCVCRSFEFSGILCRHALCVLRQEFVMVLPSKYIISRWRKDFKRMHDFTARAGTGQVVVRHGTASFNEILFRGHNCLFDISEVGSIDDDLKRFALTALEEARDKVVRYEVSRGDQTVHDEGISSNAHVMNNVSSMSNLEMLNGSFGLSGAPKGTGGKRMVGLLRDRASERGKRQKKNGDSDSASKNVGLNNNMLDTHSGLGLPMTQFNAQESFSVQVGSDWSLYNPYFYWHGSGSQDPSRRT